jgi:hypothetical protein
VVLRKGLRRGLVGEVTSAFEGESGESGGLIVIDKSLFQVCRDEAIRDGVTLVQYRGGVHGQQQKKDGDVAKEIISVGWHLLCHCCLGEKEGGAAVIHEGGIQQPNKISNGYESGMRGLFFLFFTFLCF